MTNLEDYIKENMEIYIEEHPSEPGCFIYRVRK